MKIGLITWLFDTWKVSWYKNWIERLAAGWFFISVAFDRNERGSSIVSANLILLTEKILQLFNFFIIHRFYSFDQIVTNAFQVYEALSIITELAALYNWSIVNEPEARCIMIYPN